MEKRNIYIIVEYTSMVKLNFNGKLTENIKEISRYVADFMRIYIRMTTN